MSKWSPQIFSIQCYHHAPGMCLDQDVHTTTNRFICLHAIGSSVMSIRIFFKKPAISSIVFILGEYLLFFLHQQWRTRQVISAVYSAATMLSAYENQNSGAWEFSIIFFLMSKLFSLYSAHLNYQWNYHSFNSSFLYKFFVDLFYTGLPNCLSRNLSSWAMKRALAQQSLSAWN